MSRPLLTPLATLLLLLTAAPAARAQAPLSAQAPAAPRPGEEGAVLWAEPVLPVLLLAAGGVPDGDASTDLDVRYLPVGLSLPLSERRALTLELGLGSFSECATRGDTCYARGSFGRLSVGYSASAGGQQRGAFVQPRLALTVVRAQVARGGGDLPAWYDPPTRTSPGAELGVDVGYQWRVGRLYLATMLGVGFGVVANASDEGLLLVHRAWTNPETGVQPSLSLNVNLLRVGWGL